MDGQKRRPKDKQRNETQTFTMNIFHDILEFYSFNSSLWMSLDATDVLALEELAGPPWRNPCPSVPNFIATRDTRYFLRIRKMVYYFQGSSKGQLMP
jgi:hypothetical protein